MITSKNLAKVIFVDDDLAHSRSLISSLKRRNLNCKFFSAENSKEAFNLVQKEKPDVVVLDLELEPYSGVQSGFELITQLLNLDLSFRILVLTAHGSEDYGIKTLQLGAASFLCKPVSIEHLKALIEDSIVYSRLKQKYELLNKKSQTFVFNKLSTKNKQMSAVLEQAAYSASNKLPVLIYGETGTGKGVLAQAIHSASKLYKGKLIRFQPNFSNYDLVSSELFGHSKGSFTGASLDRKGLVEEADKGTLFIDEVDDVPLQTQINLLNVLQEKSFRKLGCNKEIKSDFRLVSATNKPIQDSLRQGKLRADFYHRISHIVISLPSLRERKEDIEDLANLFLNSIVNKDNIGVQGVSLSAMNALKNYNWPGNIRELQACIETSAHRAEFAKRRFIELSDLHFKSSMQVAKKPILAFREKIKSYEEKLVLEALEKNEENQTKAASALQLDRSSFRRILERTKN